MQSKKRTKSYLYIDGTNLFMGLYDLFGVKNIPKFRKILREISRVQKVNKIFFYASYMVPRNKSEKEKELLSAEADFYRQVKERKDVYFYKGHRSPTSKKEKGVDVHLAVDIIKNAYLKKCQQTIIMTGDADLVYPIIVARKFGIKTQAIFLPNRFSLGLSHEGGKATVLNYLGKFRPVKTKKLPVKLKVLEIKMALDASTQGK